MQETVEIDNGLSEKQLAGLELLRADFEPADIGRLPKPTKEQTEEKNRALKNKDWGALVRCKECTGYHVKGVVHLDYVGHAATTKRLLDVDPEWNWEPLAVDEFGLPKLTLDGLLWIRLNILGMSRLGVGDASGKSGGDAIKECIGDAIRNGAMRFGVALELWHKGEFATNYEESDQEEKESKTENKKPELLATNVPRWNEAIAAYLRDGNLDNVLPHVNISDENQALIKKQANEKIGDA